MTAPSGELIASGRSADVYDAGPGLVLRRYRPGALHPDLSCEREAELMSLVRDHGYPVPRVERANSTDIVMERVDGPTMMQSVSRRPWGLPRHAALLADLHRQLHDITAPSWLTTRVGNGDALLHLDLHPENVILTPGGPIVIDWPNAARGDGDADVAHTWLLLATAQPSGGRAQQTMATVGRRLFLSRFLRPFEVTAVSQRLPLVAGRWLADRNVRPEERDRTLALLRRHGHDPDQLRTTTGFDPS